MNVAIIDPIPLVRVGIASSLRDEPDLDVVVDGDDVEALDVARDVRIDVAISDVVTETRSGLAIVHDIRRARPACRIVLLSIVADPIVVATLLAAGASGYVAKTQSITDVVAALRAVGAGERYVPEWCTAVANDAARADEVARRFERLTAREREVFDLVTRGFSNADIAARLFISQRTAETHRHNVIKKIGAASIADALRLVAAYRAIGSERVRSP